MLSKKAVKTKYIVKKNKRGTRFIYTDRNELIATFDKSMGAPFVADICKYLNTRYNKLVFHGACADCDAQSLYGISYCDNCMYRNSNWELSDLRIKT